MSPLLRNPSSTFDSPQGGENRQMESKRNRRAAACPLLLKKAGPEISSLTLAKVGKYTAVRMCMHQNIWRNRMLYAPYLAN